MFNDFLLPFVLIALGSVLGFPTISSTGAVGGTSFC